MINHFPGSSPETSHILVMLDSGYPHYAGEISRRSASGVCSGGLKEMALHLFSLGVTIIILFLFLSQMELVLIPGRYVFVNSSASGQNEESQ